MRVFKNKKLLSVLSGIFIPIITLILLLLINGHSLADFTLDPAVKISKLTGEKEATKVFSNDEFQLYYANADKGVTHYAFARMFGIWYCNYYPHKNDVTGITHGKNNIYYYGKFASNENYDYIESEQGEKIYPHKFELNGKVLNVYQILKNNSEKIIYRFGNSKNTINDEALFLNGEVVFYKLKNGKDSEYKTTVEKLQQDEPELWAHIEKTIELADKSKEIEEGRVYNSRESDYIEYKIFVKFDTGDFLNLEKAHKGYDWTGEISYDIEIKGQHPSTISIYTRDYSHVSLYEKTFGESHVYPVTIPGYLVSYIEGFY